MKRPELYRTMHTDYPLLTEHANCALLLNNAGIPENNAVESMAHLHLLGGQLLSMMRTAQNADYQMNRPKDERYGSTPNCLFLHYRPTEQPIWKVQLVVTNIVNMNPTVKKSLLDAGLGKNIIVQLDPLADMRDGVPLEKFNLP